MKALLQRVSEARVTIDGEVIAEIGAGLLVLLGVAARDGEAEAGTLAAKIAKLRIFADEAGKMNHSVLDVSGNALVVSQFTLCADTSRGNRPGFSRAAVPDVADALYAYFCARLEGEGVPVATGRFAAHMQVELTNDGPVTIWLDTRAE